MNIRGFLSGCGYSKSSKREEEEVEPSRIEIIIKRALKIDRNTTFSWDDSTERAVVVKKGIAATTTTLYDLRNNVVAKSTSVLGVLRPNEIGAEEKKKLQELNSLVVEFNAALNDEIAEQVKAEQAAEKSKPLTIVRNKRMVDYCKQRLSNIGNDHRFFKDLRKKEFKVQAKDFIDNLLKIEDYYLLPEFLTARTQGILGNDCAADDLLPFYEAVFLVCPEKMVAVTDRLEIFNRQLNQGNHRASGAEYLLMSLNMAQYLVTNEQAPGS